MAQERPWIGRLLGNKWATWPFILGFIALILFAFATSKRAESAESLSFVAGSAVIHATAPTFGAGVAWDGPLDTDLECAVQIVGSSTYRGVDSRNQMAFQCSLFDGVGKFDFGLGIVRLQNIDAYNGSLFNFALEARYNVTPSLFVSLRHWSNAGTTASNLGQNLALVGWKWK